MRDIFPNGIPHNRQLKANSTDSLLRVWSSISRRETQTVDANNVITGLKDRATGRRLAATLPLFNAGLVGTQRQTLYLHTNPMKDVTNFGADVLYPVLVRDAEALGIYAALGVPAGTVTTLKGPRLDIINAINLGRPIPVADGFTGDVITLDAAVDSMFPNGRRIGGGAAPNRNQVNVNSVLISLIVAGNPQRARKGVEVTTRTTTPISRSWLLLTKVCSKDMVASTFDPTDLRRRAACSRDAHHRTITSRSGINRIPDPLLIGKDLMTTPSLSRAMFCRLGCLVLAIVLSRASLMAHDMWIDPTTFSRNPARSSACGYELDRTSLRRSFRHAIPRSSTVHLRGCNRPQATRRP
jgi:hypothetical protein